ncbi:gamma-glutamyltransferase [Rubrobacter aplysinae]|uniref:gamma-glutamyltransferase n=1 Tax=Rubrobacter aplysinae TaxID=909625 RepID=UPI00064BC46F|nr:gamma-glutamyltransferase [Rubrobacter aplysinae]
MEQYDGQRPDFGGRSTVLGTKGAVACEHPRAALAGIRVLDAGGNAADACVAMAATMAVVAPMTTGMGGDAFLLFHESETGRVIGANGSGRAPRSATVEKLKSRGVEHMPERGALTVTVPGAVRLWGDAASSLGRLSLSKLLEPAREAAEEGNPVSEVVARYWKEDEELLGRDEAAVKTFLPRGRAPESGEMFHQPDLARTIRAVMEGGADAFYEGEVAANIARSVQRAGGYLAEEDLASHETTWVEPISTDYRGVKVHEIPPPGQGIAALEMLNILEGYELRELHPLSAERIHLEAEAKKLAYADLHGLIGDPEFSEVPTEELLSKKYAARLRERISLGKAATQAEPVSGTDTTYLCAVDAEGNGCSFINSLFMKFGSGVVAEGTGVCLQNRGYSFHLDEGHPNALAPAKRPLHTIIPGLATKDDNLWATFGVMGGHMQPQGHVQLLANLIDYDMSPQQAVDHPRHFHDRGTLLLEDRGSEEAAEKLRRLGHDVRIGAPYEIPTGGAQLIRVYEDGVRACGSDPRKDGCALAQ